MLNKNEIALCNRFKMKIKIYNYLYVHIYVPGFKNIVILNQVFFGRTGIFNK